MLSVFVFFNELFRFQCAWVRVCDKVVDECVKVFTFFVSVSRSRVYSPSGCWTVAKDSLFLIECRKENSQKAGSRRKWNRKIFPYGRESHCQDREKSSYQYGARECSEILSATCRDISQRNISFVCFVNKKPRVSTLSVNHEAKAAVGRKDQASATNGW